LRHSESTCGCFFTRQWREINWHREIYRDTKGGDKLSVTFLCFLFCLFNSSTTLSNLNRRLSHACIDILYKYKNYFASPLMWTIGVWIPTRASTSHCLLALLVWAVCVCVRACCFGNSKGLYYCCWGKKILIESKCLYVFLNFFALLGSIFDMVLYSIFWFSSTVEAIYPFPIMRVILQRIL